MSPVLAASEGPAWASLIIGLIAFAGVIFTGMRAREASKEAAAAQETASRIEADTSKLLRRAGAFAEWQMHKRGLIGPYVAAGRQAAGADGDLITFLKLHAEILANVHRETRDFLDAWDLPADFADEGKTREIIDRLAADARADGRAD